MTIRPAGPMDIPAIKRIAVQTNMFDTEGTGFVDDVLSGILAGALPDHHFIVDEESGGAVIGAAYFAPEPFSDRMWNLYFIAVEPEPPRGRSRGPTPWRCRTPTPTSRS
jgi:hypothetical protein